jgi:uncharacterized membrane protein YfcA/outer membrane protein OmpA-like peptidoglycan-associated protein
MNVIAILSGCLVGFTLGLVGGGGSVLATPLLLYAIVGLPPHVAIGTGAFAVSVNAFLNFLAQIRSGRIIWKVAILFAIFGSFGALIGSSLGKAMNGDALIFLFGLAMLGVGAAMLRPIEPKLDSKGEVSASATKSSLVAFAVGCLAGFFGIGGGVLIVPGLVLATRMPMLNAISTSLLAVGTFGLTTAVNYAASGFVDWIIAAQFIGGGFLGGFLGIKAGVYLSRYKGALNTAFAALTFAVASYVLYRSGSALYGPQFAPQQIAVEQAVEALPSRGAETAAGMPEQPALPATEGGAPAESSGQPALPADQAASRLEDKTASAESRNEDASAATANQAAVPRATQESGLPNGTRAEVVTGESAPTPQQKAETPRLAPNVPSTGIEAGLLAFLAEEKAPTAREAWFDLDRLQFDTGKTSPQPASEAQLRAIAEILSAYPNARIVVGGHTDMIGDARKNRTLSELRAKYVLRELTRMGVDASRLEARGYGADRPIAPNSTAEGRTKNRRISLTVIRQ